MTLVSETSLVSQIREECELELSQFVTDASIQNRIRRVAGNFYDLVIEAGGGESYSKTYSFSTAADQSLYDLPADFFRLLDVHVDDGSGNYVPLRRFNRSDKAYLKNISNPQYPYYYRTTGKLLNDTDNTDHGFQLELLPVPGSVRTVYVDYIQQMVITEGEQTRTYNFLQAGWENYVIYGVCALCVGKENVKSSSFYFQLQKEQEDKIVSSLQRGRDAGKLDRIHDRDKVVDPELWPWKGNYA